MNKYTPALNCLKSIKIKSLTFFIIVKLCNEKDLPGNLNTLKK